MASQSNISVETSHLTNAATKYDSVSKRVESLVTYFEQLKDELATACGNDDSGQKVHAQIETIKSELLKDAKLFAEVTGLTGKGIRDMRDAYEQAETDAELIAQGFDSQHDLGSAQPNSQNNSGNSNTDTSGNFRRR